MKIFLIGLTGSGKSTLGRQLAKALELPFVDLDREIETEEGMSIYQIFNERSEGHFRITEARVLKNWCDASSDFVIATGAGAPCFFDNMEMMNRAGKTVLLDVPLETIAQRLVLTNLETRPLFARTKVEDIPQQLAGQWSQRFPYYSQAQITMQGSDISATELLDAIKKETRT